MVVVWAKCKVGGGRGSSYRFFFFLHCCEMFMCLKMRKEWSKVFKDRCSCLNGVAGESFCSKNDCGKTVSLSFFCCWFVSLFWLLVHSFSSFEQNRKCGNTFVDFLCMSHEKCKCFHKSSNIWGIFYIDLSLPLSILLHFMWFAVSLEEKWNI